MRLKEIPEYKAFFSDKAVELVKWAKSENKRIKAARIIRAACRIEYYYRKTMTGITSADINIVWDGGSYTFATPVALIWPTPRPPIGGNSFKTKKTDDILTEALDWGSNQKIISYDTETKEITVDENGLMRLIMIVNPIQAPRRIRLISKGSKR